MLHLVWPRACLSALLVAVALLSSACRTAASPSVAGPGLATVERVVDGDTVSVRLAGRTERVRLLGIDTPESVKANTPVECFAKEASARLHGLLPSEVTVRLVRDVEERDRYGRLLAYVYRQPDGLFVNLDLVRGGYAQLLTYPPNLAHVDEMRQAAGDARRAGRGLWGSCPAAASLPP